VQRTRRRTAARRAGPSDTCCYVEADDSESESDEDDDDESADDAAADGSDDDDSDADEDEQREQFDVDVCPPGCSLALYTRVCNEREQRLDIEERITAERTTRDALLRDLETGKKRAKIVVDLVEMAEEELEAFQVLPAACRHTLFSAPCTVQHKLPRKYPGLL